MKYQLHTFGCKVNTYDSGLLQKNLERSGYNTERGSVDDLGAPQVHVLNTCAVTAEATKEAVRLIRKIKSKSPFSTVVVTGCAAQVDTGAFENLPGADLVVANSHKGLLPFLLDQHFKGELKEKIFKSNIFRKEDLEAGGGLEESHTRAFLKIQDGCNSFCSYCIIPYARGKSRSIPILDLVNRVNELRTQGFHEVVLTGVHVGDYEDPSRPLGNRLEDLLEAMLARTSVPRFRLTSLEPVELTDRLIDLYQNPRLCPHFHMSIQSANTEVLHGMKRLYGQNEVRQCLQKIADRLPGAFVGMDVITGFPTETDEQFEDTYKCLSETPWTRLHVFPYSERKGTKAAILPQIHLHIRKERAGRLRELSLHRYQSEALRQVGKTKQCLVLKDSKRPQAVSRDYWTILLDGEVPPASGEVSVKITGVEIAESPRMEGVLRGIYVST